MEKKESTILAGLSEAAANLFNVANLSDEMLTALLGLIHILAPWLKQAEDEALSRACDGVCFDGYTLKESSRRRIVDEEGVIEALRAVDPALIPLCQKTSLLGLAELQARLGSSNFERIITPYIERSTWKKLVPDRT